jgi:hypothetical protein
LGTAPPPHEFKRWAAIFQRFEELYGNNMGVFGRLFAKKLTTFSFEFDPSFEQNLKVSIIEDLPLPDEYQAWVCITLKHYIL